MKKLILTIAAILSMSTMAYAVPALQLDIGNGWYSTEGGTSADPGTITSTGDIFTLYALAKTQNFTDQAYYISAALTPKTSIPTNTGGSFIFAGQTINVTSDMIYGTPPIERFSGNTAATDAGDLPTHGIYETFFKEFAFRFNTANKIGSYDSQTRATNGAAIPTTGSGLYYQMFAIDTTNLAPGFQIHFDLYSEAFAKNSNTDLDINGMAPFSHDAASGNTPVPEPGTMVLLGAGMLGLAIFSKRRMNIDA